MTLRIVPCPALRRVTDEDLIDEIAASAQSNTVDRSRIPGGSYKVDSIPPKHHHDSLFYSRTYLAKLSNTTRHCPTFYLVERILLLPQLVPHHTSTTSSLRQPHQKTMAMDLYSCLFLANGTNKPANAKPNKPNDPTAVRYQSFLQGVSNDIQRYQALQTVVCGHSACKDALLKNLQGVRAG